MLTLISCLFGLSGWSTGYSAELATAQVTLMELPRVFRLDGVVEASQQSTVSAQTAGRVLEVNFDVDDYVRQGEVIVVLEETQQQAGLRQAQANLEAAKARLRDAQQTFARVEGTFQKGVVAKAELDKATAVLQQARAGEQAAAASVRQAEQELDYTQIRAPYNGIVTERLIEVGETAQPGRRLMSGLSLDSLRIAVDVPQNLVESIREQRKAQAEIGGTWVEAAEVTVFPIADPRSDTFKVRLALPAAIESVFPGMYVKVGFIVGSEVRLVIPLSAVVIRSEVVAVYVVNSEGEVRFRHVRLGSPVGPEHVSLLSGLDRGEQVATDPVAAGILLKAQRARKVSNE